MTDIANSVASSDANESFTDVAEMRSDLSRPGIDPQRGVLLAEANGQLLGYVVVMVVDGPAGLPVIHIGLKSVPQASGDVDGPLLNVALKSSFNIAAERGKSAELFLPVNDSQAQRMAFVEGLGFEPARYFFRMTADLRSMRDVASVAGGYSIRPIKGDELPKWVELFNESFIDHWHFTPLTIEQAAHFVSEDPNYCADGDLVAVASDSTFAAFCQCVIRRGENALRGLNDGWIALLGTRRGFRGQGLGKRMLRAGMEYLASKGMNRAYLGVDAENPTGALAIYKDAGFVVTHRRVAYCKKIEV